MSDKATLNVGTSNRPTRPKTGHRPRPMLNSRPMSKNAPKQNRPTVGAGKNDTKVDKILVRNPEDRCMGSVKSRPRRIFSPSRPKPGCKAVKNVEEQIKESNLCDIFTGFTPQLEESIDFSSPSLCTALQIADNILKAKSTDNPTVKGHFNSEKSDVHRPTKALKRVNIPFEKQIYKDLIGLQISDDELCSARNASVKNKEFGKNKDEVPNLEQFYKPDFSEEFIVKISPQKFNIEKVMHYNGFEITDRMKMLSDMS